MELFDYCIQSSEILNTGQEFAARLAETEKRLPPVVINLRGVIQEWIKDYDKPEPGHRHMSHLLGLYPLTQVTPESPELFKAAQATIGRRFAVYVEPYPFKNFYICIKFDLHLL